MASILLVQMFTHDFSCQRVGMLRPRLACVKHILLALSAIVLFLGAVEVGLRVHHSCEIQARGEHLNYQGLITPSWKYHHGLKPLKSTTRRNPDTNRPVGIRTNSMGLRGELISVPKPRDVFRIVYLGDETVFASEVAEEDTFCHGIAKDWKQAQGRRCEVINAGIPEYCPLLSFLQFKHSLAGLQPDLLIFNFDMSDVADDHHYRRHAKMGTDGSPLICSHLSLQSAGNQSGYSGGRGLLLLQTLKQQLGLLPADETGASDLDEIETSAGRYAWTREERPDWQVHISQAVSPIRNLRDLANQLSCPLVVTLSPVPWQVSERAMPDPLARRRWGIPVGKKYEPRLATLPIIQYLESQSIPYCDLTRPFREANQPELLFHETVPRFSRRGHLLFAKVVSEYLANWVSAVGRRSPIPSVPAGNYPRKAISSIPERGPPWANQPSMDKMPEDGLLK
jgi:hypothetical protein